MKTGSVVAGGGVLLLSLFLAGCSGSGGGRKVLRSFPVSDAQGVLADSGVVFDPEISSDGNGSLRITAADSTTFLLYEVDGIDLEDAVLLYEADLRTREVDGPVYLEMHVRIPGRGEYLTRTWKSPVTGTADWTHRWTGYLLREGEKPDRVRLNLTIWGSGTVWIDDLVLARKARP